MMKKKATLILSSGGARGLTQIGVIEELEKEGWQIDAVAGSSIGAVIGAFFAAGELDEFKTWVENLDKIDVIRYFDVSFSSKGFIKGEKVFKDLKKIMTNPQIEEFNIPYKALAADIINHKPVWFDRGDAFEAIRASVSIPGIFTPVKSGNKLFVDGAIANPLPLDAFPKKKNTSTIAVNLNARIDYKEPELDKKNKIENEYLDRIFEQWKSGFKKITGRDKQDKQKNKHGMYKILLHSFEMMQEVYTETIIDQYKPELVINISRNCADTFAFHKAKQLIEYGRSQAREAIKKQTEQNEND